MTAIFQTLRRCAYFLLLLLGTGDACLHAQQKPAGQPPASAQSHAVADPSVHGYPAQSSIQDAIKEFNARASRDPVGRTQPALTQAEVVAALRAFAQNPNAIPHAQLVRLQSIASSNMLPKGAYLRFIPGLMAVGGYDIDVWWIDLQLDLDKYPTDLADEPMHTYRIRTVYVSSRPR
jgi:hypothetical protein